MAVVPVVKMVITPPKTTAVTVPNSLAANPLSKAPNSLEEPTKIELTEATRPRILSGVFNCNMVCLMIMETPSTAPLKNKAATDSQKEVETPKTIIQTPKANTAHNNLLPAFLCSGNRVDPSIVNAAPTAGAALKIPNPSEPYMQDILGVNGQ